MNPKLHACVAFTVRTAAAAGLVLSGACLDLRVPEGVTIGCDPDDAATCPDGFACQPGLDVCVEEATLDTRAPVLTLTLTPALVARGQAVEALVTVDEGTAGAPGVSLRVNDEERAFDVDESASIPAAGTFVLRYAPRGDEPEDVAVAVRASALDAVGLRGEADGELRFDFVAPPPLPTDSSEDARGGAFILSAPGGTLLEPNPVLRLIVPANTVEEGATVVVRATADGQPFDEVTRGSDGGARANLPPGSGTPWISQRDAAGNESEPVHVREVELVERSGDAFEPLPHMSVDLSPVADLGPRARGRREQRFFGLDVLGPLTVARLDLPSPPATADGAMVWDAARSELVLVGRRNAADDALTDAWLWNGDTWVPRALGMPPRQRFALAYNPLDASTTFISGDVDGTNAIPETWQMSGGPLALEEEEISFVLNNTNEMLQCSRHSAAFDPARPGVLVVQGCSRDDTLHRQWERAADGTWTLLLEPPDPEGDGNPRASLQDWSVCMVADLARRRLVLMDNRVDVNTDGFVPDGATWEWDGFGWEMRRVADPLGEQTPAPRSSGYCAWDPVTGRTYFGGGTARLGDTGVNLNDLWAWDGATWTRMPDAPAGNRVRAMAGVDGRRGELVVFGGEGFPVGNQQTDIFDGVAWRTVAARAAGPVGRNGASLAAHDGAVFMHGGYGLDAQEDEVLWRFDDGAWHDEGLFADPDTFVQGGILTLRNGTLLYFGGDIGVGPASAVLALAPNGTTVDTSVITTFPDDGGATQWTSYGVGVHPATQTVLFGGGFRGSEPERRFWFFDGATWTEGQPVGPADASMQSPKLLWHEATTSFLLVGVNHGQTPGLMYTLPFSSPAEAAGAEWTLVAEDAYVDGAVVLDETLGTAILVGSSTDDTNGTVDEVRVWQGDSLLLVPVMDLEGDGPVPVVGEGGAGFDPVSGRTLLFGGANELAVPQARTEALDALAADRHALLVSPRADAPQFGDVEEILSARVEVRAGASASGVDGFEVRVWDRYRWVSLGSAPASTDEPGLGAFAVDAALARDAALEGRVSIGIAPVGTNDAARARLRFERVVWTVRVRLR